MTEREIELKAEIQRLETRIGELMDRRRYPQPGTVQGELDSVTEARRLLSLQLSEIQNQKYRDGVSRSEAMAVAEKERIDYPR